MIKVRKTNSQETVLKCNCNLKQIGQKLVKIIVVASDSCFKAHKSKLCKKIRQNFLQKLLQTLKNVKR